MSLIAQENSTKGEFNKFFKMPLVEFDYDLMDIPLVDYDAEFSIASKKIYEITLRCPLLVMILILNVQTKVLT